jgi:predicted nuclease of predicted toxin-antitoxin system
MPLTFIIDEHLRGPLLQAIQRHNIGGGPWIDAVQVGDTPTLPLGSKDQEILLWAERNGRIIVSQDYKLPTHLANHLRAGRNSPGVLLLRTGSQVAAVVETLAVIAHAGDPTDCLDRFLFIP